MDPLTQGLLGAALPQASLRARHAATAGLLGFFAGMAADLDVLIRSGRDPLLFLEYHRQFTHSLIFIPVGGLVTALVLHWLLGRRRGASFALSWLICTLGYATHALLDACTTYGTMLLWPFDDRRVAWNIISIIDPLFTLPLIAGVIAAARMRRPLYARLALAWACCYLGFGLWQRDAAVAVGHELAAARGHSPLRLEAKPSIGNLLLWKTVYETSDRFYVDAVRVGTFTAGPDNGAGPRVFTGASVAKLDIAQDLPWLARESQQALDIERFRWFSNGYIARDPQSVNRVIDIRYSVLPDQVDPLWSIELLPEATADAHVAYRVHRDTSRDSARRFWQMLTAE